MAGQPATAFVVEVRSLRLICAVWVELDRGRFVRWHITRAQPKVNFAVNSPIRTWTDNPDQGCVTSHELTELRAWGPPLPPHPGRGCRSSCLSGVAASARTCSADVAIRA